MKLASSDIRNHSFSSSLRGLDEEEVYTFLDRVAEHWEKREKRLQSLQKKLDEIGDTAEKARDAKRRAQEMEAEMKEKRARIEDREQELEEEREELERRKSKLRSVARRLQKTLQEEQEVLGALEAGEEVPSAPSSNGTAPERQAAEERTNGTTDTDEKSSQEWVDSLFPNRLPGDGAESPANNGGTAEEEEESEEDLSASESQFEAIKEDVQGMSGKAASPSTSAEEAEDEEKPPTDEMNQIWDVFEEAASK